MTKQVISVIGGTGLQGGGVIDALLAQGTFNVRVASRTPSSDKAKALAARGVQVVKGDLLEPASLDAFFDGAHSAFVVTNFWDPTQGPREEELGAAAVNAARSAGVKHLIWFTLPDVENLSGGRLKVKHFTHKAHVDDVVRSAGFERTTPSCRRRSTFRTSSRRSRRSLSRTVAVDGRSRWILQRVSSTPAT